MSNHLEHKPNLPKPEKMPDPTALGEHNITITDIQKGNCGCGGHGEDLRPGRLKQLQEQYETAIAECKAATKQLIDKVLSLEFVEATEAEIYAMFN